jgi:hypothetical protein
MTPSQTTWQETVVLPVGYIEEGNGRVHQEATLRKMTGNEEALLADPKLRSNGGKLITALLGSCITALEEVEKINPAVIRRLFSADRNSLLLELRRLTFGDEMEAHDRCPRCQGVTAAIQDLAALEVRRVDDCDTSPEIPVILQDGYRNPDGRWQHELVFGLPTGEDEAAAGSRRDGNPARQRDALLARCFKQVGDLESRRIQAMGIRILAELSMADRRLIQKALDDAAPGPDLTRQVICDHCGEEHRTTLDMSHFFPLG